MDIRIYLNLLESTNSEYSEMSTDVLVTLANKLIGSKSMSKYGIGKFVSGLGLFLHPDYIEDINDPSIVEAIKTAQRVDIGDFDYNMVKYTKDGSVDFIQSDDFDIDHEPSRHESIKVLADGTVKKKVKRRANPPIYHHKWQWVKPDYKGFDYRASVLRSIEWKRFFSDHGLSSSATKIGYRNLWEPYKEEFEKVITAK